MKEGDINVLPYRFTKSCFPSTRGTINKNELTSVFHDNLFCFARFSYGTPIANYKRVPLTNSLPTYSPEYAFSPKLFCKSGKLTKSVDTPVKIAQNLLSFFETNGLRICVVTDFSTKLDTKHTVKFSTNAHTKNVTRHYANPL